MTACVSLAAFALAACAASGHQPPDPQAAQDAFLDDLSRRTFDYFWETSPPSCLVPDRWPSAPFSSIAAVGFAVPAFAVGAERGYVTREAARKRTLACLETFAALPQGSAPSGTAGHHGFYYHFLRLDDGTRFKDVELSTVDSALLFAGFLFAQGYYDADHPDEARIRALAGELFARADWPAMLRPEGEDAANLSGSRGLTMGWRPERGFETHDWVGYNEGMLVYILALGSPRHPVDTSAWTEGWAARLEADWAIWQGQEHLSFAPLFGHQYSHTFIDYRGIADAFMAGKGLDYFENSRRAAYAQQAYAAENPGGFDGYDGIVWGLTASDGPGAAEGADDAPEFLRYAARGAGPFEVVDDGTIAPTAAGGMVPFAPEIAVPALMAMAERYGEALYTPYGFKDAVNPTFARYAQTSETGRVLPGVGWVADDHLGIDQGPILLMIENHRSGLVWSVLREHPVIRRGLTRAGFEGGWLDEAPE